MTWELMAARYDETDWSGSRPVESLANVANLGIRWSLPGGLQRIELTVRARSRLDAYDRYKNHLGHEIAVYDTGIDRYVSGNVYEIIPDGQHVIYITAGPWKRAEAELYSMTEFGDITIPTDHTSVVIKDILDDTCSWSSSDQSNIVDSGIDITGWIPRPENILISPTGAEAIQSLAEIGDSSNNILDFYFVFPRFDGAQLLPPLPYLTARSSTANPDWQFGLKDIAPGGLMLGRNIWDLRRNVYINYGRITGQHTTNNNETAQLIDSGFDFSNIVSPGDVIYNTTKAQQWRASGVNATNTDRVDLEPANHAGDWDINDYYTIMLRTGQIGTVSTSGETDLWASVYNDYRPELDGDQADLLSDMILEQYQYPQLQQSFVLGSPTIQDGIGARWPLWRPLFGDSFYFRVNDLFPEAALFITSDDQRQAFAAVAMDYTYADNRLRIVPATSDSRLDVLLNQADIINGQIISTSI